MEIYRSIKKFPQSEQTSLFLYTHFMKILITGMSGVGKSTLCEHLEKLGHKSFDLDDILGLCNLYHPDGTVVGAEENRVELNMLETDYLCNTDRLYKHIENQTGNVFYLGYVDNFSEVAKHFDKIVLLTTTSEENQQPRGRAPGYACGAKHWYF
jgi:broad-specificity NMP kinase